MNLSDERIEGKLFEGMVYPEEKVKEFIEKEEHLFWDCFNEDGTFNTAKFMEERDKLLGEELK